MNIFKRTILLAAAMVAVATVAPLPGAPGTAMASSISFLVNDDPVTEYDLKQRTTLIRLTTGGQGTRQQAIDELIEERLKQQAAGRLGVTANESEVDQAFNNISQRVKLSPAQFSQALQQAGVNPETLKRRLRADLAWRDVVRGQLRQRGNVSDTEIRAELSKRGDDAKKTSYQYTIQPVIFVVPQGSSQAYKRQRVQEASRYASQFAGCDGALEQARAYRDTVVQDKIRRGSSDLPPDLQEELANVSVGKASSPKEVENGVQVVGVCVRDEVQDTSAAQQEIRSEMLNEEGQRLSRRLLIDLKQAAVIEYR